MKRHITLVGIAVVCMALTACQRSAPAPISAAPPAGEFHVSDPPVISTTGRFQLLEFFTPT